MKWFKRQHQEAVSPEAFTLFLLNVTTGIVKDASQTLEKYLNAAERPKLPKVEEELLFFFVFALDYWWTIRPTRTQEDKRIFREALGVHLRNIAGGGHKGQVMLDTLQERLFAYAQIVNEEKGDQAKLLGFARKLSEFCGMPFVHFLALAPALFTQALETLFALRSVRLKLR